MSRPLEPITVISPIDPSWRDYNGHVNYAAYAMAADPAIDALYAAAGLDSAYRKAAERSDYVVESRFFYIKEIRHGQQMEARSRLIDFDNKRTHIFCEICDHDSGELSAVAHIISLHVDSRQARSAQFEAFAMRAFAELKAAHGQLPPPAVFDDTVSIARRVGRPGSSPA